VPRETRTIDDLPPDLRRIEQETQQRLASVATILAERFPDEADIQARIATVFADHTAAQRAVLTRMCRLLLHLCRATGIDRGSS
jgi:hypothetical protein